MHSHRIGALYFLLLIAFSSHGRAVDLLARYPTCLTVGDAVPEHARDWDFGSSDIFKLSHFRLAAGSKLQVETGAADLGIGHCRDGAVWAVVIPHEGDKLTSAAANKAESFSHIWLRFHPKEINRLFPPETVSADSDSSLRTQIRFIAIHKITSSWHAGGNAMIPEPNQMTVDVDTDAGPRRFFAVDLAAGTAEYIDAFEKRAVHMSSQVAGASQEYADLFQRQYVELAATYSSDQALAAFDQLWQAFDKKYAMFVLRPEVDWAGLRREYRPKVAGCKNAEEFSRLCADLLKPLRDLHIWLTVEGRNVPVFNRPRASNSNPAAHGRLLGELNGSGAVRWAVTADKIGFLAIYNWSGAAIPEQCDEVLDRMRDTRGLILDVRLNGGGSEDLAGKVASRFVPSKFVYAYSQFRDGLNHTNLTQRFEREVSPAGPWRYNRPVVVLIGQKCMSSNESFIAMMTGDPDATLMGDHTCGSSGNPEIIKLPFAMTVSVPRWIDYLPNGEPLDEHGVQPAVAFKASAGAFVGDHDDLLAAALERLRRVPLPNQPIPETTNEKSPSL